MKKSSNLRQSKFSNRGRLYQTHQSILCPHAAKDSIDCSAATYEWFQPHFRCGLHKGIVEYALCHCVMSSGLFGDRENEYDSGWWFCHLWQQLPPRINRGLIGLYTRWFLLLPSLPPTVRIDLLFVIPMGGAKVLELYHCG